MGSAKRTSEAFLERGPRAQPWAHPVRSNPSSVPDMSPSNPPSVPDMDPSIGPSHGHSESEYPQ
eukprot:3934781-Rhodomonas_salina.4